MMGWRKPVDVQGVCLSHVEYEPTSIHPGQHVICSIIAFQHVLVDDILVSSLVNFLLEEDKKIPVVVCVSEVCLELGPVI